MVTVICQVSHEGSSNEQQDLGKASGLATRWHLAYQQCIGPHGQPDDSSNLRLADHSPADGPPSTLGCRRGLTRSMLFHGERELQRLLLPTLDHLLPELPLVLDTLELRLDVLLRDLEQAQHAVVRLLCDHVQDVAEALRAALAPGLVDTKRHVLGTLLPSQQLHVGLALVQYFSIIKARPWEDAHYLRKFYYALCQRCSAMLQVLERLLVHLGSEHVVHGIHLCFPVLL